MEYTATVREYSSNMMKSYKTTSLQTNDLWVYFITAFSLPYITLLSICELIECFAIFRDRGLHIEHPRHRRKARSLFGILYRTDFRTSQRDFEATQVRRAGSAASTPKTRQLQLTHYRAGPTVPSPAINSATSYSPGK